MAVLDFRFENGSLTVTGGGRTDNFYSSDFRAKSAGDKVYIHPINQDDNNKYTQRDWLYDYGDLTLDTVDFNSAEDFVIAFNAAAGQSIGYNTQYCQQIISLNFELDTSVPMQITLWEKAGYMTISADEDNADVVYLGSDLVDDDSYQLEAGKSVFVELDDLSKYWAYCEVADCYISVLGAWKL